MTTPSELADELKKMLDVRPIVSRDVADFVRNYQDEILSSLRKLEGMEAVCSAAEWFCLVHEDPELRHEREDATEKLIQARRQALTGEAQ